MSKQIPDHVYRYIQKHVSLADFLESELSCIVKWHVPGINGSMICPMPHHKDKKPSFSIKYMEEDGVWVYNCFGCGSKGTIINFFMQYYNVNRTKAVEMICDKFGIHDIKEIAMSSIKDIGKKFDMKKKMEMANVIASNRCRMLMRQDFEANRAWVKDVYRRLNEALSKNDIDTVEAINNEVSERMTNAK